MIVNFFKQKGLFVLLLCILCVELSGCTNLETTKYGKLNICRAFEAICTNDTYPVDFSIIGLEFSCKEELSKWQFCGTDYELEINQDDMWKTIPKKSGATERLQFINENKVLIRFDKNDFDFEFTEGKYRFIQNVTENSHEDKQKDNQQIVFEFNLKDMNGEQTTVSHKVETEGYAKNNGGL